MEANQQDNGLVPADGEIEASRKEEIARAAMSMSIDIPSSATDIEVDLDKATKLPLGEMASLGTAFASLPEAFRTVTQTVSISGEGLLRATDKFGNPLDTGILQAFNDGSGLMGSFRDVSNGFGQARLHTVASQTADVVSTMPYDPTTLFMAAALMEINKKLDAIQETQQEMFEYLKNKDKARQRANLETLSDILGSYKYNWDNQKDRDANLVLVKSIRKDAREAIIQHRAEINGKLGKKSPVHVDKDVKDKAAAVRSEFGEYRLAVYLYSFASFLEVMLAQKFDHEYLRDLSDGMDEYSIEYRQLYTRAYDLIEADADSSVRAMTLGGLSGAMGFLGKAIEKTPIGDLTPIDEALQGASKGIDKFSRGVKRDMMGRLADARSSDVRPFIESVEAVNRLYNEPTMLLANKDAIYVLPIESYDNSTEKGDADEQEC